MKKVLTTTLATVILIGLVGCQKTDPNEPKTLDNAPDRLGSGIEDATQGPINAIKSGAKAVQDAVQGDNKDETKK